MEMDFLSSVKDEIALEGLDGITLETLWKRLSKRSGFPIKLDDKSKGFLWNHLVRESELQFFELPSARPPFVLHSFEELYDAQTGRITEGEDFPDIYPVNVINKNGVYGSCCTFDTRVEITALVRDECFSPILTLQQAEDRWGEKLTIVASQRMRFHSIFGSNVDPYQSWLENGITYCILERIARARYDGILSIGHCSLKVFNMNSKTMFYHTKTLVKLGFVKKQNLPVMTMNDRQQLRRVFHVTRFFRQILSKYQILIRKVADYLKDLPNQKQLLPKTCDDCEIDDKVMKKMYKSYPKYFKTNLVYYREFYPEAKPKQYMCKNGTSEKMLHCLVLIQHPNDDKKDDSDEDEEEEEEIVQKKVKDFHWTYERSLLHQMYDVLTKAGPNGLTQVDLISILNVDRYSVRTLCRNMERLKLCKMMLKERGKQKEQVYISKYYVENSALIKEFYEEKSRIFDKSIGSTSKPSNDVSPKSSKTENREKASCSKSSTEDTEGSSTQRDEDVTNTKDVTTSANQSNKIDEVTFKDTKDEYEPPKKKTKKTEYIDKLTGRHLKRMSLILSAVEKDKVLENSYTFVKMIREAEKEEGIEHSVDKKSCEKLINLLAKEGKIRILKTFVMQGDHRKEIKLLCDANVNPTDRIIQSTLEQLRMKYNSVTKQHLVDVIKKKPSKTKSPEKQTQVLADLPKTTLENFKRIEKLRTSKFKNVDMVYNPKCSKLYGYLPKMKKVRMLHNILWYLCYKNQEELKLDEATDVMADIPERITAQDVDIMTLIEKIKEPPIYCQEKNWKRYLPPIPRHKGYPPGWCLISDVLIILPLCVFCNIVCITYEVRGLKELLDDPVKSLYPISCLPYQLTQQLLFARKYIFTFHDTCEKLCNMGLLSFGAKILKEKDQVFVYVHRKAGLIDTTQCLHGGEDDGAETPEVKVTELNTQDDFDHYWAELQHVSLNSNFPTKGTKDQKSDQPPDRSKLLPETLKPVTVTTVVDDGRVPGDCKGAAGFDSMFFIHLPRNWNWNIIRNPVYNRHSRQDSLTEAAPLSSLPIVDLTSGAKHLKVKGDQTQRLPRVLSSERLTLVTGRGKESEVVQVSKTTNVKGNKGGKGVKRKSETEKLGASMKKKKRVHTVSKKSAEPAKKKSSFMDDVDYETLKYKKGQRVTWSALEDSILLTCKITTIILSMDSYGHKRTPPVPYTEIRNVLRLHAKERALDKSTDACKRRVAFTMKNPRSEHNLSVFLTEALEDKVVQKYAQKKYFPRTEEVIKDFHELVEILISKFSSLDLKESCLPSNLSNLSHYTIKEISKKVHRKPYFSDVTNTTDVILSVLTNIVHSYVSVNDKQGRAYECFKLLNQYPDEIIGKAMELMKKREMLTRLKCYEKKGRVLSGIQYYKLTQKYEYSFLSRFPPSLFGNAEECLQLLTNKENADQETKFESISKGGYCACLVSLLLMKKLSIHIQIPKDLVVLDTTQDLTRGRCLELWQDESSKQESSKSTEFQESQIKDSDKTEQEAENGSAKPNSSGPKPSVSTETTSVFNAPTPVHDTDSLGPQPSVSTETTSVFNAPTPVHDTDSSGPKPSVSTETTSVSNASTPVHDTDSSGHKLSVSTETTSVSNAPTPDHDTDSSGPKPSISTETTSVFNAPTPVHDTDSSGPKLFVSTETVSAINVPTPETNDPTRVTNVPAPVTNAPTPAHDTATSESDINPNSTKKDAASKFGKNPVTFVSSPYSSVEMDIEEFSLPSIDDTPVRSRPTASRALILMRRSSVESSVKHYSFQDNFVIDSCSVGLKVVSRSDEDPKSELFLQRGKMSGLLSKCLKTLPFEIDMEDVFKNVSPELLEVLKKTYHFIDTSGELGIRVYQLYQEFENIDELRQCLEFLEEEKAIIKTGVTVTRYVSLKNSRPWVVHAYKNTKGRGVWQDRRAEGDDIVVCQDQKLQTTSSISTDKGPSETVHSAEHTQDKQALGTEMQDEETNSEKHMEGSERLQTDDSKNTLAEDSQNTSVNDNPQADDNQKHESVQNQTTPSLSSATKKDPVKDQTPQPKGTYQRVRFVCMPWRKPEGTLNKPVFKMMLESLMFHIMSKPGVSLENIINKYTTSNQPYSKIQLLEILEDIGAIEKSMIKSAAKTTLFSKRRIPESGKLESLKEEGVTTVYIPTPECVLKVGQFISYACS